jgi:predicted phosphate transport protein (TIGR00153 family)
MFGRFMPLEGKFFELFNAHAEQIVAGGRELSALMLQLGDTVSNADQHAKTIDAIEKRADQITHETITLLHRTFITPFDRDSIHQLISNMDDILDLIQDVAESLVLYDIRQVSQEARQLTEICQSCCERVKAVVGLLSNLEHAQSILKTCREIDQLESDADRVMRAAISRLFREEKDMRQVIKFKTLYELLETVTDRCEDVANIVEGIVLENS